LLNWNTEGLLNKCIKTIKEKTFGLTYEIIIIDNNSGDNSVQMVKLDYPECQIIESKKNLGFAKGNNEAVKERPGNTYCI